MFISQIVLDPKKTQTVKALNNRQVLHGALERCFSGERQHPLWRLDNKGGRVKLLIVSNDIPDFTSFMKQFGDPDYSPMTKKYDEYVDSICKNGTLLHFTLVANPVIDKQGKRIPLNMKRTANQPYCATDWLADRMTKNGVELINSEISHYGSNGVYKAGCRPMTFVSAEYDGVLRVIDQEKFRKILLSGLGHKKAYGCGLLSVAAK